MHGVQEPIWREPGQAKDTAYLEAATLRYSAEGREVVGRNRSCFNNRPLYCPSRERGVVLAGDRPFLRLLDDHRVAGSMAWGFMRGDSSAWMHAFNSVEMRYRCGRITWTLSDPAFAGVVIILTVVPLDTVAGFAFQLVGQGLRPHDHLVWTFGGAYAGGTPGSLKGNPRWLWDPIMQGNPAICRSGDPRKPELGLVFEPEKSWNNRVLIEPFLVRILAAPDTAMGAAGCLDRPGQIHVADGKSIESPASLLASKGGDHPVVCATHELAVDTTILYGAFEIASADAPAESLASRRPREAFEKAHAYLDSVERVRIETPDDRINAAMAAVCHPMDAACDHSPTLFRHGCMAYSVLFLGWRVIFGSTMLGWHDRVKGNARHYIGLQNRDDPVRVRPVAKPELLLTSQADSSRFFGKGRIHNPPWVMYDTQSQFFDQTLHDWRWTADPELEAMLRPALELHLEWAWECFDPDDDGLYESYINTLPTDSVWYNGGGSVEESAYIYYGHLAARDMARRAGDSDAAARHHARAGKIQAAIRSVLWLEDRGHYGLYREQNGHRRVHVDAWVYSQFLPIDVGLSSRFEALQSLYYTEWGLERVRLPFGGELCQPSNWVPWKWSVRDMFNGDIWHLALAYFQTGLGDEGFKLLLGAVLESCYAGAVPGGFSHIGAGTDFSDCKDLFARSVVEGLFGFDPDYPNEIVRIHPAWPSAWPRAAIVTPDFSLDYQQGETTEAYHLSLSRPARMEFLLPVRALSILALEVNGHPVPWTVEPGFNGSLVRFTVPSGITAAIRIQTAGRYDAPVPIHYRARVGEALSLKPLRGQLIGWHDFHRVCNCATLQSGALEGVCANQEGHHLVLLETRTGELPAFEICKIEITDPVAESEHRLKTPRQASSDSGWECLDLEAVFNGDVRTIFQQSYLSPRAETCSVRLGSDGYSAWTFPFWSDKPPAIDLAHVEGLTRPDGRLWTPQQVPFTAIKGDRNIVFTSRWDNWPTMIRVPVRRRAKMAWALICGSTFPMQTRIANGVLRFSYADGTHEELELIPPLNYWMLSSWGGNDYDLDLDRFCFPDGPPPMVQLGNNCRAMVLSWRLKPGVVLDAVELETLSEDVVIGLMGLSLVS